MSSGCGDDNQIRSQHHCGPAQAWPGLKGDGKNKLIGAAAVAQWWLVGLVALIRKSNSKCTLILSLSLSCPTQAKS